MKAMVTKYGRVAEPLGEQMSRAQALRLKGLAGEAYQLRLKGLAEEAYQPEQYATHLSFEEAARRIDALKAEIALAHSF